MYCQTPILNKFKLTSFQNYIVHDHLQDLTVCCNFSTLNNVELIIDTSTDFYFVEVEIETLSAVEF
jgi:hypothetical protein